MKRKNNKKTLLKNISLQLDPRQAVTKLSYERAMQHCQALMRADNYPVAGFVLSQVANAMPREVTPRVLLLKVYLKFLKLSEAGALAQSLLAEQPNNASVLNAVADYEITIGEHQQAITLLRKAIALKPGQHAYYNTLGNAYLTTGERELAVEAFNKVIELCPDFTGAYWNRAQILRTNISSDDLAQMQALVESQKFQGKSLAMLHFALAWGVGEGQSEQHFRHLDCANKIIASITPWDEAAEAEILKASEQRFSPALIDSLSGSGCEDIEPIMICGLPRSGTTLLEQILGSHSGTQAIGETSAFSSAVNTVSAQLHQHQAFWTWPEQAMADSLRSVAGIFRDHPSVKNAGALRLIDKSIDNFLMAGLIPLVFPRARLIHIRRQPMDVALSCYQLYFGFGHAYANNLRDLIRCQRLYNGHMEYWSRCSPDQVLTVNYEDLVSQPEPQVKAILEFCGLDWEPQCLNFYQQQQTINTASYLQARQPVNTRSIGRWKPFAPYMSEAINEWEAEGSDR